MKEQLRHCIQEHMEECKYLVDDLYKHPEIGDQEFRSMRILCKMLRKEGFEITGEYVVPTGFLGVWNDGKSEPVITYMCEYDALPEVGHGYGYNLAAGVLLAAGCALKNILSNIGGGMRIADTPAEENFGGKVSMATAHVFDDMDTALILHPDTKNPLGGRALAIYPLRFGFFGQNARARTPQNGKSALDAATISYVSTNLLCQFAEPNTFIHEIIAHGGRAASVTPAYTSLECYFRGKTMEYMKESYEKAKACVEGARVMSECTSRITTCECPYDDCAINYTLADMLKNEYKDFGYPWEEVGEATQESSDIGSVSYCCSTLQGYIEIADNYVNGHPCEMAATTISQQGSRALFGEALALADIGRRLVMEPDTMGKAWKELKANRK